MCAADRLQLLHETHDHDAAPVPRRLQYRMPSHYVVNHDPDDKLGEYLPSLRKEQFEWRRGGDAGEPGEAWGTSISPEPGDFHTLAPETGAIYALPLGCYQLFIDDDIHECLVVVDYPTILGGRKVIQIAASQRSVWFIKKSMRHLVPQMRENREILSRHFGSTRGSEGGEGHQDGKPPP